MGAGIAGALAGALGSGADRIRADEALQRQIQLNQIIQELQNTGAMERLQVQQGGMDSRAAASQQFDLLKFLQKRQDDLGKEQRGAVRDILPTDNLEFLPPEGQAGVFDAARTGTAPSPEIMALLAEIDRSLAHEGAELGARPGILSQQEAMRLQIEQGNRIADALIERGMELDPKIEVNLRAGNMFGSNRGQFPNEGRGPFDIPATGEFTSVHRTAKTLNLEGQGSQLDKLAAHLGMSLEELKSHQVGSRIPDDVLVGLSARAALRTMPTDINPRIREGLLQKIEASGLELTPLEQLDLEFPR